MKHRTKHLIHDFVHISMHYCLHVSNCVYNLVISLFVSVHCSTNNCTNIVVSCTFCLINKQQKYIPPPPPLIITTLKQKIKFFFKVVSPPPGQCTSYHNINSCHTRPNLQPLMMVKEVQVVSQTPPTYGDHPAVVLRQRDREDILSVQLYMNL